MEVIKFKNKRLLKLEPGKRSGKIQGGEYDI